MRGPKRLGQEGKENTGNESTFLYRLEDTHIARGSSSTACQCPPTPFLFPLSSEGDLVRVRCRDNLTCTRSIHYHSPELLTKLLNFHSLLSVLAQ